MADDETNNNDKNNNGNNIENDDENNFVSSTTSNQQQLCGDILYAIAQQMLFGTRPTGADWRIDLRVPNAYTMFMCHRRANMTAMLAQMAKMRRIVFARDRHGRRQISMYRNNLDCIGIFDTKSQIEFAGPYLVNAEFVFDLLMCQKLRITHIQCCGDLARGSEQSDFGVNERSSSWQAFCALFLHKKLPILAGAQPSSLSVDLLQLDEQIENIRQNFEAILLLNAEEILFYCYERINVLFDCSSYNNQINANRTRRITFKTNILVSATRSELAEGEFFRRHFYRICSRASTFCLPAVRTFAFWIFNWF